MKENHNIQNHLYNGQTIIISGIESLYYPKELINEIIKSEVNDLTLIYAGDIGESILNLIKNDQVKKLVTSHLDKEFKNYNDYLDEVELLPTDILAFKIQASANHLPGHGGFYVDKNYAKLYRDDNYIESHMFTMPNGKDVVLEEPFKADIAISFVDNIDLETFDCSFDSPSFNCIDVSKAANMCFVKYSNVVKDMNPNDVDIVGQYINGVKATGK